MTDRPNPDVTSMPSATSSNPSTSVLNLPSTSASFTNLSFSSNSSIPSTSSMNSHFPVQLVTPEQLRPFPKAGPRKGRGGRNRTKSRILTDTPVKAEIEKKHNLKKTKKTSQNNKKVKKQTKKRILDLSSDSETELENFHLSSDEDAVDDFEDSRTNIENGDFDLAKFTTKSSLLHFIGRVIEENGNDFSINFLKRSDACSFCFIYPEKEDIATVSRSDLTKLPHPMISGGTERVALKMKFNCDFSKYQNLY